MVIPGHGCLEMVNMKPWARKKKGEENEATRKEVAW
jgi:hypothetical protein